MNKYGKLAQKHWQATDPARYQAIPDPIEFFTLLGQQAQERIETLAQQLAGPDRLGESYLEKVGRLNSARQNAESDAIRELLLIPDPTDEADGNTPASDLWSRSGQLQNYLNSLSDEELEALDPSSLP